MAISGLIGVLYAAGIFLLLRRSLIKATMGILLLGHAANLLILVAAGYMPGVPVIRPGDSVLQEISPDPLPQALILTAIVIGLGVGAFLIALIYRTALCFGGDDLDSLRDEE